jgi:hypothetical protein
MKTKNRTKPLTHLVWIDIHSTNTPIGVHNPVAYGFVDPELLKFLNGFGLKSEYTIETISKSGWEQVTK